MSNQIDISRTRVTADADLDKITRDLKKNKMTQWFVVTDLRTGQVALEWTRPGVTIPQWWR
jgi:hypothetical protein